MESAFIGCLEDAVAKSKTPELSTGEAMVSTPPSPHDMTVSNKKIGLDLRRLFRCSRRKTLEFYRDPSRATLALLGVLFLCLSWDMGLPWM